MRHAILSACVPLLLIGLSACGGGKIAPGGASDRAASAKAAKRALAQCTAALNQMQVRYTLLPDRSGGACTLTSAVSVQDFGGGITVTGLGPMRCGVAEAFAQWVREDVPRAAKQAFGVRLIRLQSYGTYACRTIGGSNRLSQHASGNAIDVGAFRLANNRLITVRTGWQGPKDEQEFLRAIRASACRRFGTVLSPDYNAAHADHLHFDLGGTNFCR